jgi:hypothetical protein
MIGRRHKLSRDPRTGIYYVKVQVEKARQRFTFGKSRKPAEAALRKLEHELSAGRIQIGASPQVAASASVDGLRLGSLVQRHLEWVQNNRSPATFACRRHFLAAFLKFAGDCRVADLNRMLVENFYAWARKQRGKSANGGNAYLRHVKTMFIWAEEMGLCECPVKKFPQAPEVLPLARRFTDDELSTLFSVIPERFGDFKDALLFGLLTGLRPQEIRQLEKQHIMRDGNGDLFLYPGAPQDGPIRAQTDLPERAADGRVAGNRPAATAGASRFAAPVPERRRRPVQAADLPAPASPLVQAGGHPAPAAVCAPAHVRSMEAEANINQTSLSQIIGHTTIRTTSRYISNNYDHHRKAVSAIESRVASLNPQPLVLVSKTA